jgi:CBS domain-containing protein
MRKVRDIMTEDVATASPTSTLAEIAGMMRDEDTGAIPVVDEDELVGIVTDRDIVIRCIAPGKHPAEVAAEEILSEQLEVIEPESDVEEAARLMERRQIRRLPVVENGRLVGMVSLGDIAVKAGEEQAGDTLEGVSQGVKAAPRPAGGKQPSPGARLERERGEHKLPAARPKASQEISNRSAREEEQRQTKVVPIRAQGKGKRSRPRRAS